MLPSKTELIYAAKGGFDLYTITNVSFMDIAYARKINLNVYAVTKENLAERTFNVDLFSNIDTFTTGELSIRPKNQPKAHEPVEFTFEVNATFDLKHDKDSIYEVSAKLKEVIGHVNNLAVLERQSFEVLVNDLKDDITIEKVVRLNLLDYGKDKHTYIAKVVKDGQPVLIISDTLSYQSHVPFQSILLPMRVCILGAEAKNFISCPHVWTLQWERNPDSFQTGDLFLTKDHANISASSPGIGPNLDEYGPRFYDISSMYEKRFSQAIADTLAAHSIKYC